MEHIYYEIPSDSMVVVSKESVERIKEKAHECRLTTNRLIIKSGLDKSIIEGLYYGKHRIRLSHLRTICEVIFKASSAELLEDTSDNSPVI